MKNLFLLIFFVTGCCQHLTIQDNRDCEDPVELRDCEDTMGWGDSDTGLNLDSETVERIDVGCKDEYAEVRVEFDEFWSLTICCNIELDGPNILVSDNTGNYFELDRDTGMARLTTKGPGLPVKYRGHFVGSVNVKNNQFWGKIEGLEVEGYYEDE